MKYLIFLALLCGCQYVSTVKETAKPELTYNPKKDSLVNALLDTKPVKVDKWDVDGHYYCFLYYPEYKISIINYAQKDFESKGEWHFWMDAKDGTDILIETSNGVTEHTISDATHERLKTFIKP